MDFGCPPPSAPVNLMDSLLDLGAPTMPVMQMSAPGVSLLDMDVPATLPGAPMATTDNDTIKQLRAEQEKSQQV